MAIIQELIALDTLASNQAVMFDCLRDASSINKYKRR